MSGVPWPLAAKVARRIAGTNPLYESYHRAVLAEQAVDVVARAEQLVAEETGLPPGPPASVTVVDRPAWVDQNLRFFEKVIEPAQQSVGAGLVGEGLGSLKPIANRALAAETGALLGFLSRKVLGQYELVLPSDEDTGDMVYLVGPNVLELEREHQFRPAEFRMWIALHECAHRLQFVGVPWLRDYFLDLVTELVASAKPEPGRWGRVIDELRQAAASPEPLIGEQGIFGLLATPTQREVIDRVQALMSVLEGHGHVVMDRLGSRILVSSKRMSDLIKQRRKDPRTAALFRITGLEMKMRQYAEGEKFILRVEERAGWGALDALWVSPESLPTLAEIRDPDSWLQRAA